MEQELLNNRKKAIAMHNAGKKRFADIFTGCLAHGTLKQTQKKKACFKLKKD